MLELKAFLVKPKHQMGQTWALTIISTLFMIGHYKHVLFIGIHSFDALVLWEKLFFLSFSLKSRFIYQKGQTWIPTIISILFVIGHNKHVLFIGIRGFNALFLQEKLFFLSFSIKSKFIHQMAWIWILMIIFILFVIRH